MAQQLPTDGIDASAVQSIRATAEAQGWQSAQPHIEIDANSNRNPGVPLSGQLPLEEKDGHIGIPGGIVGIPVPIKGEGGHASLPQQPPRTEILKLFTMQYTE